MTETILVDSGYFIKIIRSRS